MLKCPVQVHHLHKFRHNDRLYIADLDRFRLVEINQIAWDAVELSLTMDTQGLIYQLSQTYPRELVLQTLEMLGDFQSNDVIFYPIGGARGRQRFIQSFKDVFSSSPDSSPNPLIAHLITSGDNPPAFVSLGTPLKNRAHVEKWAETVSEIFGMIKRGTFGGSLLQKAYRLQEARGLR